MSRPDEGLIHTWLDGECSADEAAEIERLVATDPEWAAAVAEARGLVAASSRIVSALDAVPARVLPVGSTAAPGVEKIAPASPELSVRNGFRVRPWMKMAAGVVLVAGTAFALRETTREVFAPVTPVTPVTPETARSPVVAAPQPEPVTVADRVGTVAKASPARTRQASEPSGVVTSARARVATGAPPNVSADAAAQVAETAAPAAPAPAAAAAAAAGAGAVGRSVEAGAPAASPAAAEDSRAARFEALQRRLQGSPLSQVVTTGTRGAEPEKILDSPNLIASAVTRLEGCWNVTAPDSLRTVLRNPLFTRGDADSLVVVFVLGSTRRVTAVQNGDALRGEITAKRVECPKP